MSRILPKIIGLLIIAVSFYFGFRGNEKTIEKIQHEQESAMATNHLSKEKSPYLLQHQDNPVHWYAWGEEAFKAARDQKKLIFLSIGYSTCHWCHVMEKDSFEREDVADVLNEHFISIKVDREERPDVDQIYMDAVVALTGQGGWPMSVFLTPDLKPFFGGTFYWRAQFIPLLQNVAQLWKSDPKKIIESGQELVAHIQSSSEGNSATKLGIEQLKSAIEFFKKGFDSVNGGFGSAPKFPRSIDLSLLMRMYINDKDPQVLALLTKTLDAMARGGIFDHLGGGFARYATDAKWLIPHFEKMLYDNALLAHTYGEAYQLTQNPVYKSIVKETLDYVLRDMTSPDGGFYSAEDADSEGEEGKFYVWSFDELSQLLDESELKEIQTVFGVTQNGQFEHKTNILHLPATADWKSRETDSIRSIREKLLSVRNKRIHPLKDTKILTEWNGLMIAAMSKGYQILGDERYLKAAQKAAIFIEKNLYINSGLKRRYRDGETRFDGVLNDYAYLTWGLLELSQTDFDTKWVEWAAKLNQKQNELFWDAKDGGYYFSPENSENLYYRKKEFNDGATPSGNGLSALNLLKLFSLTYDKDYLDKAQRIFELASKTMDRYPPGFASTLLALDYSIHGLKEMVVIAKKDQPDWVSLKKYLFDHLMPHIVLVSAPKESAQLPVMEGKKSEGDFTAYFCEKQLCRAPQKDFVSVQKMLESF